MIDIIKNIPSQDMGNSKWYDKTRFGSSVSQCIADVEVTAPCYQENRIKLTAVNWFQDSSSAAEPESF